MRNNVRVTEHELHGERFADGARDPEDHGDRNAAARRGHENARDRFPARGAQGGDPSRSATGTVRSASSESEITVGRIMIDSTIPAASKPSPSLWNILAMSGTSNVSPEPAVNDRGNSDEHLDRGLHHGGDPRRREFGEENADRHAERPATSIAKPVATSDPMMKGARAVLMRRIVEVRREQEFERRHVVDEK